MNVEEAAEKYGMTWFDYQLDAFDRWQKLESKKGLVFYPTGKGKSKTMLTMMAIVGETEAVVIAPPSTHAKWQEDADTLGMTIKVMSHAMFRQKTTKLSRKVPVICDEFHLLGGHTGMGWKKFDHMAGALKVPVIIGSATPQYNDAERVYCIVHALDANSHRGGYLTWLYENCVTANNPFGAVPTVERFREWGSAEEYLASLPYVMYLPDEAPDIMSDVIVRYEERPFEFYEYGVDRSRKRIMASPMEIKQRESLLRILDPLEDGRYRVSDDVAEQLGILDGDGIFPGQVLMFANRSTVAGALHEMFVEGGAGAATTEESWYWSAGYVDGTMTTKAKEAELNLFRQGHYRVLIGTASMATGTDGIDKVCDHLVIVDDTEDDSLRRQLVGRVLPRGILEENAYEKKRAYRFVYWNA